MYDWLGLCGHKGESSGPIMAHSEAAPISQGAMTAQNAATKSCFMATMLDIWHRNRTRTTGQYQVTYFNCTLSTGAWQYQSCKLNRNWIQMAILWHWTTLISNNNIFFIFHIFYFTKYLSIIHILWKTGTWMTHRSSYNWHDKLLEGCRIQTYRDSEISKNTKSCIIYPLKLKRDSSATNYLHPGDVS